MFDEAALLEKLRKIEALYAGATTEGERAAAAQAAQRFAERLAQARSKEADVVRQYSIHDTSSRTLFVALCRRYGLRPYRYPRQHRSTLCVRAPESIHSKLWEHYCAADDVLRKHVEEATNHVIRTAVDGDTSEVPVVAERGDLPSR
jgi:hypothetical protein